MRRFFFAAAVLALTATCPLAGWAGDREIAEQIIKRLKVQRDAGTLKGFKLDLKVEQGVVLFNGKVSDPEQKTAVLSAAKGLEGIAEVVDQIAVDATTDQAREAEAPEATVAEAPKVVENPYGGFSFRQALEAEASRMLPLPMTTAEPSGAAPVGLPKPAATAPELAGAYNAADNQLPAPLVMAASANEAPAGDQSVTQAIVGGLGQAQRDGRLRGFGVDVSTEAGEVYLKGRTSTAATKAFIIDLARNTPGVRNVIDDITVFAPQPLQTAAAGSMSEASSAPEAPNLQEVRVQRVAHPMTPSNGPVTQAAPMPTRMAANYNMAAGGVSYAGMQGRPMPMAPYAAGQAAPRSDQPYLPNHAWPGYAPYPNYAAVTYPQQYSPSAWPYIGPFYPYPQVPLGWRKVSLEWDDGWWFLDFSDRNGHH